MAEKVEKMGIQREPGWLYFLRESDVYKTPMKRGTGEPTKTELVRKGSFKRVEGWLYYIDAWGDVARSRRMIPAKRKKS